MPASTGIPQLLRERARARLVAEQLERLGGRPHEREPGGGAAPRELGVLGQEPVARVQRVAARGARRGDDAVDVEIGRRAAPAQRLRRVGLARVQRARLVLGVDRDAAQPARRGGAHHADRDLAAVGDEQALEGHRAPRNAPSPAPRNQPTSCLNSGRQTADSVLGWTS